MTKRYVLIEKELGALVGLMDKYILFAKHECFGIDRVTSFKTKEDAQMFAEGINVKNHEYDIVECNAVNEYVLVSELIKEGYGLYTHQMMNNIKMISTTIH